MITLTVDGMTCAGCARSVTAALARLDPEAEVAVTLETGAVAIRSTRPRAELAAAIEAAGFGVRAA